MAGDNDAPRGISAERGSPEDLGLQPQTGSQTVGPFFHYGLIFSGGENLAGEATQGEWIVLTGVVSDGGGEPVPDAMIEIWQADANGHFHHPADPEAAKADPAFKGFGRSRTDVEGRYRFETVSYTHLTLPTIYSV